MTRPFTILQMLGLILITAALITVSYMHGKSVVQQEYLPKIEANIKRMDSLTPIYHTQVEVQSLKLTIQSYQGLLYSYKTLHTLDSLYILDLKSKLPKSVTSTIWRTSNPPHGTKQ